MNEKQSKRVWITCMLVGWLSVCSATAMAELYVGGQIGGNFPQDLTGVNGIETIQGVDVSGVTFSDLQLENGPAFGLKAGGYFPGFLSWLGLELDAYHAMADIKAQPFTASVPLSSLGINAPGTIAGSGNTNTIDFSVTTVALNVMARYPGSLLQPYVGAGIGGNVAIMKEGSSNVKDADFAPAFNAVAGLRVKVIHMVGIFAEYKYNRNLTEFKFKDNNFAADYSSNLIMGGVSIHFP